MKEHTKTYIAAMGLDKTEPIYSELSGEVATDIHHIDRRGFGSTANPEANSIFNLMALTRDEHIKYGDIVKYKDWLKVKHMKYLMSKGSRILGIFREVNFEREKVRGEERYINKVVFQDDNDE